MADTRFEQDYEALLAQGYTLDKILQVHSSLSPSVLSHLYLAAVRKYGANLRYVPHNAENYYEICLEAVSHYGEALEFVPVPQSLTAISRYEKICEVAIQKAASALAHVPQNLRSKPLCELAVKKDGRMLQAVPLPLRDHDLCLLGVMQNGLALRYVPQDLRTYDICLAAVMQNGEAISEVPEKLQNDHPDLIISALKQNGNVLRLLPIPLRDQQRSLVAVSQNGNALPHVPPDVLNYEICLAAVIENPLILARVPLQFKQPPADMPNIPDIRLVAVSKNWQAIAHVPVDMRDEKICLEALKQNVMALEFVPEAFIREHPNLWINEVEKTPAILRFIPPDLLTYEICLKAVMQDWRALEHVPAYLKEKHFDISEAALKQNWMAMRYLPNSKESFDFCLERITQDGMLLDFVPTMLKGYDTICLAAVTQNGLALGKIPEKLRDAKLCLTAVKENGRAILDVPDHLKDREICLIAVQSDPFAFFSVPKSLQQDYKICFAAVEKNGLLLNLIPENLRDYPLCLAAVSESGLALEHVPKHLSEYREICLAAVKENGLAIKFVDEKIREEIIEAVGVDKILSDNYGARAFIPAKYEGQIKDFLSRIKHVVITDNDVLRDDHEMKDIYLVYSAATKRSGNVVHVDRDHAGLLLNELKGKQPVNLVLLGHANATAETIAGTNMTEVAQCLELCSNIERVTLLGCNTAKSQKLEEEKADIRYFAQTEKNPKYGIILLSKPFNPSDYKMLLTKNDLDAAFIVTKSDSMGKASYQLIHIEEDPKKGTLIEQKIPLTEDGLKQLQNTFRRGKELPFPKNNDPIYMRGGTTDFLDRSELAKTFEVMEGASRFDKRHPKFKTSKENFPFLRNVTIDESEAGKLEESLLKKLFVAVKQNLNIKQNITAKGYTKALHVDTKERRMHVTETHLYPSSYKFSTFYKNQDNINRKKLADERKATVEEMRKSNVQGATTVKSIKLTIKKIFNR